MQLQCALWSQKLLRADGKKKVCASYDTHEYSNRMKAQQIVATGGSCIAFFVTMYWSIRGLTAFLGLLGPLQVAPQLIAIYRHSSRVQLRHNIQGKRAHNTQVEQMWVLTAEKTAGGNKSKCELGNY